MGVVLNFPAPARHLDAVPTVELAFASERLRSASVALEQAFDLMLSCIEAKVTEMNRALPLELQARFSSQQRELLDLIELAHANRWCLPDRRAGQIVMDDVQWVRKSNDCG